MSKGCLLALGALALASGLAAGPASAGYYTCGSRTVQSQTCPNGEPAMFHGGSAPAGGGGGADLPLCRDGGGRYSGGGYFCNGRPNPTDTCPDGGIAEFRAGSIEACGSLEVRQITREQMEEMDRRLGAEAARIARIWTHDGRLTPQQVQAIREGTCILAPFANPELMCVHGYGH